MVLLAEFYCKLYEYLQTATVSNKTSVDPDQPVLSVLFVPLECLKQCQQHLHCLLIDCHISNSVDSDQDCLDVQADLGLCWSSRGAASFL